MLEDLLSLVAISANTNLLLIFLALTPSLIWLFHYLSKDIHPEPKKLILFIFVLGALSTIPTAFIEIGLTNILNNFAIENFYLRTFVYMVFAIGITEELMKFLVVKVGISNNKEFNEPIDAMIYMVTAAMGFAALENFFYITGGDQGHLITASIIITIFRFFGANFLHALCSAILGFFYAKSLINKNKKYLIQGVLISGLLHGIFNYYIMTQEQFFTKILGVFGFLFILALIVSLCFKDLRKKNKELLTKFLNK